MSTPPDTTTRREYTDEEILRASADAIQAPNMGTFTLPWFRSFLDALPERPQAQPVPWPGQQEAINAAFLLSKCGTLDASGSADWAIQDPARLAIAQAYDAARPQAAEIARLKASLFQAQEAAKDLLDQRDKAQGILKACLSVMPFGNIETHTVENLPGRIADLASEISALSLENERLEAEIARWRSELSAVMPADFKCWHRNNPAEWPAVAAQVIRNLRAREDSALEDVGRVQAELAALRQPILADDGRSLGQVYMDALKQHWGTIEDMECSEAADKAVAAVVEARIIRRMEAVPVEKINESYHAGFSHGMGLEAVRALFIAAAKGDGHVESGSNVAVGSDGAVYHNPEKTYAQAEEAECVRMWLDSVNAPVQDAAGKHYSLVGRIQAWAATAKGEAALSAIDDEGNPATTSDEPSEPYHAEEVPQAEPATFEAHGKVWTRHTPGDPMPCDGEARVSWLLREELSGDWEYRNLSVTAQALLWEVVVGWRYADEPAQAQKAEAQPWTPAVGDTVRLKSGGPVMTVRGHEETDCCYVVWFVHNQPHEGRLPTACLTPAKP